MSGVAPEVEMRVREAEAGCDERTRTLIDPTKKLSVANEGALLQLIGDAALPGIIPQLRADVAELTATVATLTQAVSTLAAQVAVNAPPSGIKPALIKHGTTGAALGTTGGVIYILAALVRHFIGG